LYPMSDRTRMPPGRFLDWDWRSNKQGKKFRWSCRMAHQNLNIYPAVIRLSGKPMALSIWSSLWIALTPPGSVMPSMDMAHRTWLWTIIRPTSILGLSMWLNLNRWPLPRFSMTIFRIGDWLLTKLLPMHSFRAWWVIRLVSVHLM